jgi:hypothetical protein
MERIPPHVETIIIDDHNVRVNQMVDLWTVAAVCECGVTAVSGTLAKVESMIKAKHKKRNAGLRAIP